MGKCKHETKTNALICSGYGLTEYEFCFCIKCGVLIWRITKDIENLYPKLKGTHNTCRTQTMKNLKERVKELLKEVLDRGEKTLDGGIKIAELEAHICALEDGRETLYPQDYYAWKKKCKVLEQKLAGYEDEAKCFKNYAEICADNWELTQELAKREKEFSSLEGLWGDNEALRRNRIDIHTQLTKAEAEIERWRRWKEDHWYVEDHYPIDKALSDCQRLNKKLREDAEALSGRYGWVGYEQLQCQDTEAEKEPQRILDKLSAIPQVAEEDGSGCDSGDPADFVETQICLALAKLEDRADEAEKQWKRFFNSTGRWSKKCVEQQAHISLLVGCLKEIETSNLRADACPPEVIAELFLKQNPAIQQEVERIRKLEAVAEAVRAHAIASEPCNSSGKMVQTATSEILLLKLKELEALAERKD
ncbi:MAG TPA: hypothetical protein ENH82_00795 [bacterium]|nr:hypothetical protein [bacterium]